MTYSPPRRPRTRADRHARIPRWERGLMEMLALYEAELLTRALSEHAGNVERAAHVLHIARTTMAYRMAKLGVVRP